MDKGYFCDDDCKYLYPRECDQVDKRIDHMCMLFNVRLLHEEYHPKILKYKKCHRIVFIRGE